MRISDWSSDVCSSDLNAGVVYNSKPLHEIPDEAIDWCINVNIYGVLNGIKAFVPIVVEAGNGGHVVNTGSIGGFQVRKSELWHQGLYAATKYAVTALSEGLRFDLEHLGIGVSVLAPRSEEHTSELQSLMRISYAVFCLNKKNT